jgi:hydrogenase maturation protease
MTRQASAPADPEPATAHRSVSKARHVEVELLVCGSRDRADDGAPMVAVEQLGRLPGHVRARIVGQLDIDDLLAVPAGARVVIVDAAIGIRPGHVVELPLTGFIGRTDGLRPRSSHALSFPDVIGLTELMRGRPVRGEIVAIGGVHFGLGEPLSGAVAKAIPALVSAIRGAIDRDGG